MWLRIVPVLIKLLTSIMESVVQWWFTTEIKAYMESIREKRKKGKENDKV